MTAPTRARTRIALELNRELDRFPDDHGRDINCRGRGDEWMDYPRSDAPTQAEARMMCAGCPAARLLCREYGVALGASGVWGGASLIDGKMFREENAAAEAGDLEQPQAA